MRGIKFRVWDKKTKKMRKINSIVFDQLTEEIKLVNLWGRDIIENKDIIIQRESGYILMQCTGLKDKNGREIYEGDIYHMGDKNIRYVVVWNDSGLVGKQLGSKSYAGLIYWQSKIEIIGNIYENKDLLEVGNE